MADAKVLAILTMTALATIGLGARRAQAQAFFKAYPATLCAFETDFAGDYVIDGHGGVANASDGAGARPRRIHCPIESDSSLRQEEISVVEVYYEDNNRNASGAVRVFICQQSIGLPPPAPPNPGIGNCSDGTTSTNGRSFLVANADAITKLRTRAAGFFSEIVVEIPEVQKGRRSTVFGIGLRYDHKF